MARFNLLLPALTLLVLTACGEVSSTIVDAASIDGQTTDGGTDLDAASATAVQLTVRTANGPVRAGVPVYFQNADSTVVAMHLTGVDGIASQVMAPGGSVTALIEGSIVGNIDSVHTYSGVKPGDHLQLAVNPPFIGIAVDVTFPSLNSYTHYRVDTGCGGTEQFLTSTPTSTVTLPVNLFACGVATDFVITTDNGDGGPQSMLVASNVAVADGTAVTLTGAYAAAVNTTVSVDGLSTSAGAFELGQAWVSPRGQFFQASGTVDALGGAATASLTTPTTAVGQGVVISTARVPFGGISGPVIAEVGVSGDHAIHAAGLTLHPFATTPQFDQTSHAISWTEDATGATPDLSYINLQVSRSATETQWTWEMVAAHQTTMTLPVVPTDVADINVASNDFVILNGVATATGPGGYDAMRPIALGRDSLEALAAVVGSGQRVVFEVLQPQLGRPMPFRRR
jgi:hypothetical protein